MSLLPSEGEPPGGPSTSHNDARKVTADGETRQPPQLTALFESASHGRKVEPQSAMVVPLLSGQPPFEQPGGARRELINTNQSGRRQGRTISLSSGPQPVPLIPQAAHRRSPRKLSELEPSLEHQDPWAASQQQQQQPSYGRPPPPLLSSEQRRWTSNRPNTKYTASYQTEPSMLTEADFPPISQTFGAPPTSLAANLAAGEPQRVSPRRVPSLVDMMVNYGMSSKAPYQPSNCVPHHFAENQQLSTQQTTPLMNVQLRTPPPGLFGPKYEFKETPLNKLDLITIHCKSRDLNKPTLAAMLHKNSTQREIVAAKVELSEQMEQLSPSSASTRDVPLPLSTASLPFLAEHQIIPLPKPNPNFPAAILYCQLCDYHIMSIDHVNAHWEVHLKEEERGHDREELVRSLPKPTQPHLDAIEKTITMKVQELWDPERGVKKQQQADDVIGALRALIQRLLDKHGRSENKIDLEYFTETLEPSGVSINVDVVEANSTFFCELFIGALENEKSQFLDVQIPDAAVSAVDVTFKKNEESTAFPVHIVWQKAESAKLYRLFEVYAKVEPRLTQLRCFVHWWAQTSDLTNEEDLDAAYAIPKTALDVMIIHALQQSDDLPVVHEIRNDSNELLKEDVTDILAAWTPKEKWHFGRIFLSLLKYYTQMPRHIAIQMSAKEELPKLKVKYNRKLLIVLDPIKCRQMCSPQRSFTWYLFNCFLASYVYFAVPRTEKGPLINVTLFQRTNTSPIKSKAEKKKSKLQLPPKRKPTTAQVEEESAKNNEPNTSRTAAVVPIIPTKAVEPDPEVLAEQLKRLEEAPRLSALFDECFEEKKMEEKSDIAAAVPDRHFNGFANETEPHPDEKQPAADPPDDDEDDASAEETADQAQTPRSAKKKRRRRRQPDEEHLVSSEETITEAIERTRKSPAKILRQLLDAETLRHAPAPVLTTEGDSSWFEADENDYVEWSALPGEKMFVRRRAVERAPLAYYLRQVHEERLAATAEADVSSMTQSVSASEEYHESVPEESVMSSTLTLEGTRDGEQETDVMEQLQTSVDNDTSKHGHGTPGEGVSDGAQQRSPRWEDLNLEEQELFLGNSSTTTKFSYNVLPESRDHVWRNVADNNDDVFLTLSNNEQPEALPPALLPAAQDVEAFSRKSSTSTCGNMPPAPPTTPVLCREDEAEERPRADDFRETPVLDATSPSLSPCDEENNQSMVDGVVPQAQKPGEPKKSSVKLKLFTKDDDPVFTLPRHFRVGIRAFEQQPGDIRLNVAVLRFAAYSPQLINALDRWFPQFACNVLVVLFTRGTEGVRRGYNVLPSRREMFVTSHGAADFAVIMPLPVRRRVCPWSTGTSPAYLIERDEPGLLALSINARGQGENQRVRFIVASIPVATDKEHQRTYIDHLEQLLGRKCAPTLVIADCHRIQNNARVEKRLEGLAWSHSLEIRPLFAAAPPGCGAKMKKRRQLLSAVNVLTRIAEKREAVEEAEEEEVYVFERLEQLEKHDYEAGALVKIRLTRPEHLVIHGKVLSEMEPADFELDDGEMVYSRERIMSIMGGVDPPLEASETLFEYQLYQPRGRVINKGSTSKKTPKGQKKKNEDKFVSNFADDRDLEWKKTPVKTSADVQRTLVPLLGCLHVAGGSTSIDPTSRTKEDEAREEWAVDYDKTEVEKANTEDTIGATVGQCEAVEEVATPPTPKESPAAVRNKKKERKRQKNSEKLLLALSTGAETATREDDARNEWAVGYEEAENKEEEFVLPEQKEETAAVEEELSIGSTFEEFYVHMDSTINKDEVEQKTEEMTVDDFQFSLASKSNFTAGYCRDLRCSACDSPSHLLPRCPEMMLPDIIEFPETPLDDKAYQELSRIINQYHREEGVTREGTDKMRRLLDELYPLLVNQFSHTIRLDLFGSSRNGFGTKLSDVDICFRFEEGTTEYYGMDIKSPNCVSQVIANIEKGLKSKRSCFYQVMAITTAKVPIVKFTANLTDDDGAERFRFDGDISYYNELALHNTDLLEAYCGWAPDKLPQLGIFVKRWAKACEIGDASRGSLSSYAYVILLIHFLQRTEPPVLPILQERGELKEHIVCDWNVAFDHSEPDLTWSQNKKSVGELFLEFLDYFAKFDWRTRVIQMRRSRAMPKYEKMWAGKWVAIEDPFELSHNLGSGVSSKMCVYIRKCFISSRETFHKLAADNFGNFDMEHILRECLPNMSVPTCRLCQNCGRIGHTIESCTGRWLSLDETPSTTNIRRPPMREERRRYDERGQNRNYQQKGASGAQRGGGRWVQQKRYGGAGGYDQNMMGGYRNTQTARFPNRQTTADYGRPPNYDK